MSLLAVVGEGPSGVGGCYRSKGFYTVPQILHSLLDDYVLIFCALGGVLVDRSELEGLSRATDVRFMRLWFWPLIGYIASAATVWSGLVPEEAHQEQRG